MKYSPFILIVSLFISTIGYSQKTEPLKAKIYYHYIYKYDKADTAQQLQTDVVLMAGATNSKFINAEYDFSGPIPDYILHPAVKPDMSKVDTHQGGRFFIDVRSKLLPIESWYRLPEADKMVLLGIIGFNDFKAAMPIPVIEWEIKDEFREIGNVHCQKAEGDFGGRHYIAWFAPSLPLPYGPWKLGGLPGIILEARDTKNEVQFLFKNMPEVKDYEVVYYEEFHPTMVSEATYKKVMDKYQKDPIAFAKSQLSKNDEVAGIRFEEGNENTLTGAAALEAIKASIKLQITNPLELNK